MQVVVTYRKTSRLSMRIGKNGEVRASAPFGMPESEVQRFVDEHRDWIAKAMQNTAARQEQRQAFYDQLPLTTRQECREATERMNAIIPPLVEKYSNLMGVKPSSISYKATISKWGCCHTRSKRIMFSAYLLLLPEWCIEHVVVHELAHIIVPNHSAKFYAVMDKYFPRWREARAETKRISRMEVEE